MTVARTVPSGPRSSIGSVSPEAPVVVGSPATTTTTWPSYTGARKRACIVPPASQSSPQVAVAGRVM